MESLGRSSSSLEPLMMSSQTWKRNALTNSQPKSWRGFLNIHVFQQRTFTPGGPPFTIVVMVLCNVKLQQRSLDGPPVTLTFDLEKTLHQLLQMKERYLSHTEAKETQTLSEVWGWGFNNTSLKQQPSTKYSDPGSYQKHILDTRLWKPKRIYLQAQNSQGRFPRITWSRQNIICGEFIKWTPVPECNDRFSIIKKILPACGEYFLLLRALSMHPNMSSERAADPEWFCHSLLRLHLGRLSQQGIWR